MKLEKNQKKLKRLQFHKRSVVRGLLKWLHTHEDYHITNLAPLIRLKKVKQDNIKHELLTYQDAQNLVEVCGNQRDRAIVSFLIDGGVLWVSYSG